MADRYNSFSELVRNAAPGRDFRRRLRKRPGTTVIVAPHGGEIEPGTSEIAEAVAGEDLSFYAFEGTRPAGNGDLHVTSTRFDEPLGTALVAASPRAVSIHGEAGEREVVFLGGRDAALRRRLRDSLTAGGFSVETHRSPALQGGSEANLCNRCRSGRGVQLELSKGLRRSFFQSLSRRGRQDRTERFHLFIAAVREGIL